MNIKKVFISFIFCVSLVMSVFADGSLFKFDDNIDDFVKKHKKMHAVNTKKLFGFEMNSVLGLPEGQIVCLSTKKNPTKTDVFLLSAGGAVFGVMQDKNGEREFLYDLDNNGTLDAKSSVPLLTVDILTNSKYTRKSSKNNVDACLNEFYKIFNGTENPYKSGKLRTQIRKMLTLAVNKNTKNRDIIYGIFMYYLLLQQHPYVDITNLVVIDKLYRERFSLKDTEDGHPLTTLHIIENLINRGDKKNAIYETERAVKNNPNFVPFQVYSWQLETNQAEKQKKYKKLKKEHPNHWIVKQI